MTISVFCSYYYYYYYLHHTIKCYNLHKTVFLSLQNAKIYQSTGEFKRSISIFFWAKICWMKLCLGVKTYVFGLRYAALQKREENISLLWRESSIVNSQYLFPTRNSVFHYIYHTNWFATGVTVQAQNDIASTLWF